MHWNKKCDQKILKKLKHSAWRGEVTEKDQPKRPSDGQVPEARKRL